jgi:hypothetical protein
MRYPRERSTITVQCGCGVCGQSFERFEPQRGQGRVYAPGCEVRREAVKAKNRESSNRANARLAKQNPRRCHCGCGKQVPPRLWYHPDCQDKKASSRRECVSRTRVPKGRCGLCQDQSWRRHPDIGCPRCGGQYAAERIRRPEPNLGCGIGQVL